GFPSVTVVRWAPVRAPYSNLETKCLTNQTLPSLAYGGHSCSLVFKVEPQNKFLKTWAPAVETWARGDKVVKLIGYDGGDRDRKRSSKAAGAIATADDAHLYDYQFPLQQWGWNRDRCKAEIAAAGLPVPIKSSCFFCPAMKQSEIAEQK